MHGCGFTPCKELSHLMTRKIIHNTPPPLANFEAGFLDNEVSKCRAMRLRTIPHRDYCKAIILFCVRPSKAWFGTKKRLGVLHVAWYVCCVCLLRASGRLSMLLPRPNRDSRFVVATVFMSVEIHFAAFSITSGLHINSASRCRTGYAMLGLFVVHLHHVRTGLGFVLLMLLCEYAHI